MRVLLPIHARGDGWLGGMNYFNSLLSALQRHPSEIELFVASNQPGHFASSGINPDRLIEAPWLDGWSRIDHFLNGAIKILTRYNPRLFRLAKDLGVDLISHSNPARGAPCPTLFWMADFQHRHLPGMFSRYEYWRRERNVIQAARSGHLLVSSDSAREDFRRFFPQMGATEVHVLRFVPLETASGPDSDQLPDALHRGEYFLFPGQCWRHKNHRLVLEALQQLPDDYTVVSTGALFDSRGNAHLDALQQDLRRLGLERRFRFLGVLPRAQLLALMTQARAILNPSLVEGWSTVVEEAKRLGKQTILSDIPVHREQDPVDAIYFRPDSAEELAAAMRLARPRDLAADAARAAAAQAARPALEKQFAEQYWAIVRRIIGSGR